MLKEFQMGKLDKWWVFSEVKSLFFLWYAEANLKLHYIRMYTVHTCTCVHV